MARTSYLRVLANRAANTAPSVLPPRSVGRALPVNVTSERTELPPSAVRVPAIAEHVQPVPFEGAEDADEERLDAPPVQVSAPSERPTPPETAPRAALRPEADFTFEAPPALHVNDRIAAPSPVQARETPSRSPPPTPDARRPRPSHTPIEMPDPLAAALASAVQWTSSDTPPRAQVLPPESAAAVEPRAQLVARNPRQPIAPASSAPPHEAAAPASRRAAAPTATPSERFTSIHVGSVEVEVVAAAEPPKPTTRPTVARPAATPLARGFTSRFGLRQS